MFLWKIQAIDKFVLYIQVIDSSKIPYINFKLTMKTVIFTENVFVF